MNAVSTNTPYKIFNQQLQFSITVLQALHVLRVDMFFALAGAVRAAHFARAFYVSHFSRFVTFSRNGNIKPTKIFRRALQPADIFFKSIVSCNSSALHNSLNHAWVTEKRLPAKRAETVSW